MTLIDTTVLIRLKRKMFDPYAFDSYQTAKVEHETGVTKAGRYNKRLFLDCFELSDTNSAFNDVYRYVNSNSVPWLDDGVRWVHVGPAFMDFRAGVEQLIKVARGKVDILASKWDMLVAKDMTRLGSLANSGDYPSNIRTKYDIDFRVMPMPNVSDFRVAISDDDKQSLARAVEDAKANATKHLISEMLEPLTKAAKKLAIPSGEDGSVFRDSLITNISDVLERAKKLNFLNDPTVNQLIDDIDRSVGRYSVAPDILRENTAARSQAHAQMSDIISKMAGLY
jgi:hypothetical protein